MTYLLKKGKVKERIFISSPPGPVPLIWCNFSSLPKISGITFVRSMDWKQSEGLEYQTICEVFKNQIPASIPLLDIQYNKDCSEFIIDNVKLNASEAATLISEKLGIPLGKNAAKRPNDSTQINDPFHVWSRSIFDGIGVRKLDIDAITLSEDKRLIKTIIEVKRSKTVPIGKWLPYISTHGNTDYWNYIITFTFCKILRCDFVTFHHEVMDNNVEFQDDFKVEQFPFRFSTIISNETVSYFGSVKNRVIISAKELI